MHYDVAIVGLGYVGLTFGAALADTGQKVLGIERRQDVVDATNRGRAHFSEVGLDGVLKHVTTAKRFTAKQYFQDSDSADIYVITVGTPLKDDGNARLDFIEQASREVAQNMKDGALVILRSTVKIGVARNVVAPILKETGKAFHIAMCPERTLEGKAMYELRRLPQIVGADDKDTREMAARFFYQLTRTVVQVASLETAEVIKLVDNTFRDVQFGFANEVARICDALGINAIEVIEGGKFGYPRTNVALPGLVGGPCLEKDPHILLQSLLDIGISLDITAAARRVNETQVSESVEFIASMIHHRGFVNPKVSILGLAFKGVPSTNDLRGSMALKVIDELRSSVPDAEIYVYDSVCEAGEIAERVGEAVICKTLDEALEGASCTVIANNHPDFSKDPPAVLVRKMADLGFVFDYWNHFSDRRPAEIGENYYSIGNSRRGRN